MVVFLRLFKASHVKRVNRKDQRINQCSHCRNHSNEWLCKSHPVEAAVCRYSSK